jgi:hypothetical protein
VALYSLFCLSILSLSFHPQILQPETTKILAISPNQLTIGTFKTAYHKGMKLKKIVTPPSFVGDVAALRVTLVANRAARNMAIAKGLAAANGQAIALNQAQIEWCILMGIWPLNNNKRPGSRHFGKYRELYNAVKDYPINNIKSRLEAGTPVTSADLDPFCEQARLKIKRCHELIDHCPWHGIFEPKRCVRPSCRFCRGLAPASH